MTDQRNREPIFGDFWGHNFGPIEEPEEARKAMGWALIVVAWMAGSLAFLSYATQDTTGYVVAALLALLAVPVYLRKRPFVILTILLGSAVLAFEVYAKVQSGSFNGLILRLFLAYALLQAFRGWRHRPV